MQRLVIKWLLRENGFPHILLFYGVAFFTVQHFIEMVEQTDHIIPLVEIGRANELAKFPEVMGSEAAEVVVEVGVLHSYF